MTQDELAVMDGGKCIQNRNNILEACRHSYDEGHIRSNGFSKVSFCKKTEISRPTLDKILNGEIDSKSTFDKHLNKILTSLSIDPDTLMGFSPRMQSADAVFSENAPIDYL